MFYKYRALAVTTKQTIANYYGISVKQLIERHYYCYWYKFFVNRFVGNFR